MSLLSVQVLRKHSDSFPAPGILYLFQDPRDQSFPRASVSGFSGAFYMRFTEVSISGFPEIAISGFPALSESVFSRASASELFSKMKKAPAPAVK